MGNVLEKYTAAVRRSLHVTPHKLRQRFSPACNNGADLRSVQELLGHASLSSHTQIYTHVTTERMEEDMMQRRPAGLSDCPICRRHWAAPELGELLGRERGL